MYNKAQAVNTAKTFQLPEYYIIFKDSVQITVNTSTPLQVKKKSFTVGVLNVSTWLAVCIF